MSRECPNCENGDIVKYGIRTNKTKPPLQRYFCRSCNKAFEVVLTQAEAPREWDKDVKRAIVTPDKHFPYEDKPAINALVKAIELVKPSIYVDLGDTGEWESVSM